MTLTLNILVALLIAIGVSAGAFLVGGRHEENAARALASAEASLSTVRDPAARELAGKQAARWNRSLAPIFRVISWRTSAVEDALVRATAIRIVLAARMIPLSIYALTLGFLAGMLRRDRARDLVLYSSVTFSYFGKCVALLGIAFGVFVGLTPFAPPLWTLYPAIGMAALGATLYVGNLPPRL